MLLSEKTKVIFLKVFFPCFLCENEDKVFCIIKKNDSCIGISIHDLKRKNELVKQSIKISLSS